MTRTQQFSMVALTAALSLACDPDDGMPPDAGGTAAQGSEGGDSGGSGGDGGGPDGGGPDDGGADGDGPDGGPDDGGPDDGGPDDGGPDDGDPDADGDTAGDDGGADDGNNAACAGDPQGHALGNVAADWTLTDGDGNDVNLHDYCGKVIFLEIGAEW